jgi:iron(II)-dependent oxidoreductase
LAVLSLLALALAGPRVEVPGGSARLGAETEPDNPERAVTVQPFSIDRDEVSLAEFEDWAAGGYASGEHWSEAGRAWLSQSAGGLGADQRRADRSSDHPVVGVSFYEAEAYCAAQGGRLPTEAEWELAACGAEGGRRFPWGDEELAASWNDHAKYGQLSGIETDPVHQQAAELAGPYGLHHASGNVWEWTSDGYHREGPVPESAWRTLRGGSFANLPSYCTCTHREPAEPERQALTVGFRCAYER